MEKFKFEYRCGHTTEETHTTKDSQAYYKKRDCPSCQRQYVVGDADLSSSSRGLPKLTGSGSEFEQAILNREEFAEFLDTVKIEVPTYLAGNHRSQGLKEAISEFIFDKISHGEVLLQEKTDAPFWHHNPHGNFGAQAFAAVPLKSNKYTSPYFLPLTEAILMELTDTQKRDLYTRADAIEGSTSVLE